MILALAACQGQGQVAATSTTPAPPPASTSTPLVLPPTWTPTPLLPTATASWTLLPTTPGRETASPTSTALSSTSTPTATTDLTLTNKVEFVADVTVPDGTPIAAGQAFTKTWRLKNVGTATWTKDYALVFVSGAQMAGPAVLKLPTEVPPGQTIDLSLALTAPDLLAFYTGFWQLQNAQGAGFGVGAEANQPIYVQIQVVAGATASATPGPIQPTAPAGTLRITAATISTLSSTVTAECPYIFTFTGSFTSEGAGTATYRLEAQANTPGFSFDLPAPFDSTFTDAGPRTFFFAYNLEFRNSVSGQVWLKVLTPNTLESSRLNFALTCTP